jgi:colanic acid/amylovoran biosynthesis glycosyltransferase
MADALERLLSDPALRTQMAERGRALIEAEFDVDRNAALLRALFGSGVQTISTGLRAVG